MKLQSVHKLLFALMYPIVSAGECPRCQYRAETELLVSIISWTSSLVTAFPSCYTLQYVKLLFNFELSQSVVLYNDIVFFCCIIGKELGDTFDWKGIKNYRAT